MKNGLVSLIIPVYNVDKYLKECIDSVLNQTYRNIEVILIDDASTDSSGKICDEYALKDKRVRVIHKDNEGQGIARNRGLDIANGCAVCFVDSDDVISPITVEHAYAVFEKNNADLVVFGLNSLDNSGNIISSQIPATPEDVYYGVEITTRFLPYFLGRDPKTGTDYGLYMSACLCMVSYDIIESTGWRFISERKICSEDTYSLLKLCSSLRCVAILKEALYGYRANDASYSRTYDPMRYEKIKHHYQECLALCRELEYPDVVIERLPNLYFAFTISEMKQIVFFEKNMRNATLCLKKIANDDLFSERISPKYVKCQKTSRRLLFWLFRKRCYFWACLIIRVRS